MKRVTLAVLALATCVSAPISAFAATVVRTYSVVSNPLSGPVSNVSATFTVRLDPINVGSAQLLAFAQNGGGAAFSVPAETINIFADPTVLLIGGQPSGAVGLSSAQNDFEIGISINPDGQLTTGNASVNYSLGGTIFYGNGSVSDITNGAVPEPASWVMMMVGIGMLGGAARRRRQKALAAFA